MSKTNEKSNKENSSDEAEECNKTSTRKSTGRGRARGRGRRTKSTPRKNSQKKEMNEIDDEDKLDKDEPSPQNDAEKQKKDFEMSIKLENEFDIQSLPSFISTTSFNSESQVWNNHVNLIGQKCPNIMIHLCDKCSEPILIYGRLIPCKHAFCLNCSNEHQGNCFTCSERIVNIEECSLGTLFICSKENCKRTYLSERDLLAHINHRHASKIRQNQVNTLPSTSSSSLTAVNRLTHEGKNDLTKPSSQPSSTLITSSSSSSNFLINKLIKQIGTMPNPCGPPSGGRTQSTAYKTPGNRLQSSFNSPRISSSSSSASHAYSSLDNFTSSSTTRPYLP